MVKGQLENEDRVQADAQAPVKYRWGAICLISIPLIVLNSVWIANSELRMQGITELTISSFFIGIAFMLIVLVTINALVRKLFGAARAFNQAEMMILYSVLSMSSAVAGVGNIGYLISFLATPYLGENAASGASFLPKLPLWMYPHDRAVLHGYTEGKTTFFQAATVHAWLPSLVTWGGFLLILLWLNYCTASILRKRWVEEEHLPFPVVQLPLEMTRPNSPLFRNKLFWLGVAIPAILYTIDTIGSIIPNFPSFPINAPNDITTALTKPWSGLTPLVISIHPAGIGFGFLIHTDVLFSVWFFFLFRKVLNMIGIFTGLRDPQNYVWSAGDFASQFPFLGFQAMGAWICFALLMLYQNRHYFQGYLRRAITGTDTDVDKDEPLSARMGVIGIVGSFLALCSFIWVLGGSWWLPPFLIGAYLLFMITMARLQAETAVLSPSTAWLSPQSLETDVIGTLGIHAIDRIHMGILQAFNQDYRASPMPHQFQAIVGQERAHGRMRPLAPILMGASVIAIACAMVADLQMYYTYGSGTGNVNGAQPFIAYLNWLGVDGWVRHPSGPTPHCLVWMGVGAAITLLMSFCRTRFVGFPFSPAAFVLSVSPANDLFWLDMLIAWAIKASILRYGGIRAYRTALPFFFGLIIGDFGTGALWSIFGAVTHLHLYQTFP